MMRYLKSSNSLQVSGPARVLAYYLAFSAIWIVTSDILVHRLQLSHAVFHIVKGLLFVSCSGAILWWLSRRLVMEASRLEGTVSEIFEQSEFGVFITDEAGRILDCNEPCARMFGYRPQEIIGGYLPRFIPPHQFCGSATNGKTDAGAVTSPDSVHQYTTRKGQLFSARVAASRAELKTGEVLIVGILQNVTNEVTACRTVQQQQAQLSNMSLAVKQSEARSKLLMDTDLVGIIVVTSQGKILDANDYFLSMLGYSREEMENGSLNWMSLTPAGFEEADRLALYDLRHQKRVSPFEKEYIARDGTRIPVLISANWLSEDQDGVMEALVSVIDLREIKKAEAQMSRLALAVESAYESIVITDLEGNIVYVNRAFESLTGYSSSEVLGTRAEAFVSDRTSPEVVEEIWAALRHGKAWRGRIWNRRRDESEYLEDTTITPVRDSSGKIINFLGVRKDITREYVLEHQLMQSQKIESVGQLAGGIAHDLNNVLQVIHSSAELGQRKTHDPEYVSRKLADILRASGKGAAIIAQLLAFTRKEVVTPRLTNLNDVVNETAKLLRRLLPENIDFRSDLAHGLELVEADPVQLSQVIINLCVNARDAMPDGGTLRVSTSNREAGTGQTFVLLSVQDTGTGMDERTKAKIFEPFFTTKEHGKGTGLGLSTVHEIVQRIGGTIEVESTIGSGTRFDVSFPVTESKIESAAVEPTTTNSGNFALTGTILVCEDDSSVRSAVCEYLEMVGLRVVRCANPAEAKELAESHSPAMLITDVIMPGSSGVQLAGALREKNNQLKVLLITGHTEHEILRTIRRDEHTMFLQKPFTTVSLMQALRELVTNAKSPI